MRKTLMFALLAGLLLTKPATARTPDPRLALHLAASAALTYGIYALMHYGLGIEDKYGCYLFGAIATQIAGAAYEVDSFMYDEDTNHVSKALLYNAVGSITVAIPVAIFE